MYSEVDDGVTFYYDDDGNIVGFEPLPPYI